MDPVPGIPNSEIFIGGGEEHVGGNPCEDRMYRPAIVLTGYLPGVYTNTMLPMLTHQVKLYHQHSVYQVCYQLISFTNSPFPLYKSTNFSGQNLYFTIFSNCLLFATYI